MQRQPAAHACGVGAAASSADAASAVRTQLAANTRPRRNLVRVIATLAYSALRRPRSSGITPRAPLGGRTRPPQLSLTPKSPVRSTPQFELGLDFGIGFGIEFSIRSDYGSARILRVCLKNVSAGGITPPALIHFSVFPLVGKQGHPVRILAVLRD
jgi:hypothetical protein